MTPRKHVGAMLSQIAQIADSQVVDAETPCAAHSVQSARRWKACVAYSNEQLLGDELDECCAEERRAQAAEDERLSRQLRWLGMPRWFERWAS